jgi:hypothetical protein
LKRAQQIQPHTLRELHPSRLSDPREVESVLNRLQRSEVRLRSGMNRRVQPEEAVLSRINPESLIVRIHGFEPRAGEIFLNFELDGRSYLASTELLSASPEEDGWTQLEVTRPAELFLKERRGRFRRSDDAPRSQGWRVRVVGLAEPAEGLVVDVSETGIGLEVAGHLSVSPGTGLTLQFLSGERAGEERAADVRHSVVENGWTRVGAKLRANGFQGEIPVRKLSTLLPSSRRESAARTVRMLRSSVKLAASKAADRAGLRRKVRHRPDVVRFVDASGHRMVGIVDAFLTGVPPVAVVIPPAWGRTKETLLPLAKTIIATFRAANESVVVLRFDGVRKRGESFNDSGPSEASAHHRFTISQGVHDIEAARGFLGDHYSPAKTVLVTFSAAGIDARAALARDVAKHLDGWVCVVGP